MKKSFGKYELLERLGGGGMAEVFRARLRGPEGFEKELALKLILPHFSQEAEFVSMFIHEATLAARLDHASIVRIHEFDRVGDNYYIAMELVDGKDLRAVAARARKVDRPLEVAEVLMIGMEVSRGLAFAHGELTPGVAPVIHRDISPHNIIVSRTGEVKITDFGIAKLASAASVTKTGVIKGKAAYMSPEQARGERVGPESDLFSMGCVLWELLSGQRLFSGANDVAVLEALLQGPIHRPSEHNPACDEEIDRLVMKLLERRPEKRMDSAGKLAGELDRLLSLRGVNRNVVLLEMYRELFGQQKPGTDRFEAVGDEMQNAPVGPEEIDGVRPVGPDAQTQGESGSNSRLVTRGRAPDGQRARKWLRHTLLAASVVCVALLVALLLFDWMKGRAADGERARGVEEAAVSGTSAVEAPKDESRDVRMAAEGEGDTTRAATESESPPRAQADDAGHSGEDEAAGDSADSGAASIGARHKRVSHGSLHLNVIPWAKVFWRDKYLGDTPLEGKRLPVGKQRLRLVNDELGTERVIEVEIRPGRETRRVVKLNKNK